MGVNRKDVKWLLREAGHERARAKFYLDHPQHDTLGMAHKHREARAAQFERIAKWIDDTLPRRAKR